MKRIDASFSHLLSSVFVVFALTASASPALTARHYVLHDLGAMWDGIENAGWGTHNDATNRWTCLASDGFDWALVSGKYAWDASGLRAKASATVATYAAACTSFRTQEIVFDHSDAGNTYLVCWGDTSNQRMLASYKTGSYGGPAVQFATGKGTWAVSLGATNTVAATYAGPTPTIYANGSTATYAGSDSWGSKGATCYLYNYAGKSYFAIRLYSAVLTPTELAWNAMVDRHRFLGEPLADGDYGAYRVSDGTVAGAFSAASADDSLGTCTMTLGGTAYAGDGARHWQSVPGDGTVTFTATPVAASAAFWKWTGDVGDLTPAQRTSPTLTVTADAARNLVAQFKEDGETSVRYYPIAFVEGTGQQWVDTEALLRCGQSFRIRWSQNPSVAFNSAGRNGAWGVDTYAHGWQGSGYRQSCTDGYPMTVYHNGYKGFDPALNYLTFVLGDVYEDVCRVAADFFSYTTCHLADGKTGNIDPIVNDEGGDYVTATSIRLLRSAATSSGSYMSYKRVHGATLFDTATGAAVFNLVPVEREVDQADGTVAVTTMLYDTVNGREVLNMTATALLAGSRTTANGARWRAGRMEVETAASASDGGTVSVNGGAAAQADAAWTACGETVTLKALPDAGHVFVGWGGGDVAATDRFTVEIAVTADRARTLVAQFAPAAEENAYWVFSPTGALNHAINGTSLKAKLGAGNITVTGLNTLSVNSNLDLNCTIYSEDLSRTFLLTGISHNAFNNNKQLVHVKLPDTVTWIGNSTFNGCTSLSLVRMSQNIASFGSYAFANIDINSHLWFYPQPFPPPTVTSIASSAFRFSWLTNDTFILNNPKFTTFSSEILGRCSMRKIDMRYTGITTIGDGITCTADYLTEVYFPTGLVSVTSTSGFLGWCKVLEGVYFSGGPVTYAAKNCMNYTTFTCACWYLPKWNKDWEAYLADPEKALLTDMTSKDCQNYVSVHGDETMPVQTLKMGTPAADTWIYGSGTMGLRWWYPDPPPIYEEVSYFDILAWEGTNGVASAGAERLFDGTTWTANAAQTQYVWSNAANASVTWELPEAATNARALKLTGYRLHQACIEKTTVGKVTTSHRPNGRAPTAWKLEGRRTVDGAWVTLDEVTMTGASAQHWKYFDYETYAETVPARTNGVVTYAIAAAKQDAYRAFRFTPTKSYNTENGVADATPIALTEIEFLGLVTTAEPRIDSFAQTGAGWNDLAFAGVVSGLGDDATKGAHATAAWAWVELADDAGFTENVHRSAVQPVSVNVPLALTVAGLAGNTNYCARLVVSNDLDAVSAKALEGRAATLDAPWDMDNPVCSFDADSNVVVNVDFAAVYAAGGVTVHVYVTPALGGAYTWLLDRTVTAAGATAISTGYKTDKPSACVKVVVEADGVTRDYVAGVRPFWVANAASAPTAISNFVHGTTFSVTASSTNLTLASIVDLGASTSVDFSSPICSADGSVTFALASIGTAFKQNVDVTEVILPEGVTEIPANAFHSCYGLVHVHLPNTLTTIRSYGFYDCANLANLEPCLPPCCTKFETQAFYNCDALKAVRFPEGTTRLASSLFLNCSRLGDVWLPDSLTILDDGAFWECTALSNVYPRPIPHNVTFVGVRTYKFCNELLPKTLVADCPGTLTLSEESFNRTHPVVVDLGGCGGLYLAGNSSLASSDSGETVFRRLVLPPVVDLNGYKLLSTYCGCESVTNITFMGAPPVNVGTVDPFLSANNAMYVVPNRPKYDRVWTNYLTEHPDWVQPMTESDVAAFRKAFPGERQVPAVKLQLGGVGTFRYLQRLTPRPLRVIVL